MSFVEVRTIDHAFAPIQRQAWSRPAAFPSSHFLEHNLRRACVNPDCDMSEASITEDIR